MLIVPEPCERSNGATRERSHADSTLKTVWPALLVQPRDSASPISGRTLLVRRCYGPPMTAPTGLTSDSDAQSQAPAPLRTDLPALTGLRAVAATWVVLYHFRDDMVRLVPISDAIRPAAAAGYLGVDLFFVLSGFIITHAYLRRQNITKWSGARSFLWLRLARCYPVHLFTLASVAVLLLAERSGQDLLEQEDGYTPVSFARNVLLVHAWGVDSFAWNSVSWSVSAEWSAYLAFPALCVILLRLPLPLAVLGAATSLPVSLLLGAVLIPDFVHLSSGPPLLRIAGGFTAGCCVYLLWERRPGRCLAWGWCAWPLLGACVALAGFLVSHGYNAMFAAPIMPLVIYGVAKGERGMSSFLSRRPLRVGGAVSYSLYMTHLLTLGVLIRLVPVERWSGPFGPVGAVFYIGIVWAVAYVTWRYVEEPARKAMRRRGRSRWP